MDLSSRLPGSAPSPGPQNPVPALQSKQQWPQSKSARGQKGWRLVGGRPFESEGHWNEAHARGLLLYEQNPPTSFSDWQGKLTLKQGENSPNTLGSSCPASVRGGPTDDPRPERKSPRTDGGGKPFDFQHFWKSDPTFCGPSGPLRRQRDFHLDVTQHNGLSIVVWSISNPTPFGTLVATPMPRLTIRNALYDGLQIVGGLPNTCEAPWP